MQNFESYPKSNENLDNKQEKVYLDLELGDLSSINKNSQNLSTSSSPPEPKRVDPIEIIKKMISTGFTPTKAQIINAKQDLKGPKESSNTWFAMLLQKLTRMAKVKNAKKSN